MQPDPVAEIDESVLHARSIAYRLQGERARRILRSMKLTEALGWASSMILVLTIAKQVYKQWQSGSSEGVSRWLFVGQIAASVGFTTYSFLVHNWVFVATNAPMLCNALVGYGIVLRHRRRAAALKRARSARSGASLPQHATQ
jgi:MtN3 and saliva related transmembrane protein